MSLSYARITFSCPECGEELSTYLNIKNNRKAGDNQWRCTKCRWLIIVDITVYAEFDDEDSSGE